MESNKETELTRKRDRLVDGEQMTDHGGGGVRLGGGGMEEKGERTHGHGQQCGDCWEMGNIWGLNGNGTNIIKIKTWGKKDLNKVCML